MMASYDQEFIARGPQYVAEPVFIHNSFTEDLPPPVQALPISKKNSNKYKPTKPYTPGAVLSENAETAFVASGVSQQFDNVNFMNEIPDFSAQFATLGEANDPGAESDCSTTDTMNDAMSMQMTASDGSGYGSVSPYMMPDMGMLAEGPWPAYPGAEYWMGYPQAPPQPQQSWSQSSGGYSQGSIAHRLGKCKPCAFMYKEGCRSGMDCPYCHLCPPGEKQRRKRVMRAMQRTVGGQ